jgi:hypothetical protein
MNKEDEAKQAHKSVMEQSKKERQKEGMWAFILIAHRLHMEMSA